jgi:carboxylate-amine ligase
VRIGHRRPMRTVGVEEELLLVDPGTGRPRAVAGQVLRRSGEADDGSGDGSIGHEMKQEQLETDTAPHSSMDDLRKELCAWRARAGSVAREGDAKVLATGTSPLHVDPHLVRTERFLEMADRFGLTGHEQLTCACHVHVQVDSDDEAVAVMDRVRPWLPVLLALSANSPFWQGEETGYASFRWQALSRWPTSGPTDLHGTAARYRRHVEGLLATEVLLDEGMLYADARPSHKYPTLEIRVADVCLDVGDAVMVAALCRALVDTAAEEWRTGTDPSPASTAMVRMATWQASREGVGGRLLDPGSFRPRPAVEVVRALLDHVHSGLERNGDRDLVEEQVAAVLDRGTGADRQRAVLEHTGSLTDVVADLARATGAT